MGTIMGLLGWIIGGAIVGWVASIVTGRNAQQGLLGNIVAGIVGAFVGGALYLSLIHISEPTRPY